MRFTEKEEKLIRLGLNQSAQGCEIDTSAVKLFNSLRERKVDAETIINGNGNVDSSKVASLESQITRLLNENIALRSDSRRYMRDADEARSQVRDAEGRGYNRGYSDARDAFSGSRETRREESEPKRDSERSGRSSGKRGFRPTPEQSAQKAEWERIAREYDGESEDFVLEFGRCRGQKLAIASLNWLEWAVREIHDMPYTIEIIVDYLEQLKRNRR